MFSEVLQENKNTVRCVAYLLFLAVIAAVFFFQYREDVNHDLQQARNGVLFEETRWGGTQNDLLVKPVPGEPNYGSVDAEIPGQVMRNMTYRLFRDISNNQFDTYLFWVLPAHKSLNTENLQRVTDIFEKITGKSIHDVDAEFNQMDLEKVMATGNMTEEKARAYLKSDYYKKLAEEFTPGNAMMRLCNYEDYMPVDPNLSYEEYKNLIGEVRHIIGRKTLHYEDFSAYGELPLTYDQALSRFETFVNKDRISGAYARPFCTDMGFVLGIAPALIAAETAIRAIKRRKKDKNGRSSKEPGLDRIWVRFFSITAVTLIPVLILAIAAAIELSVGVRALGLSAGGFAFISDTFVWLLPTIMLSAAAGLLCTTAAERFAGVLVPLVYWSWSARYWGGDGQGILYGANMILRHNVVGKYEIYHASLGGILLNRAAYVAAAFILVAILPFVERFNFTRK